MLLLDVREPEEHAFCALADSVLIPLGELVSRVEEVPTRRAGGGLPPSRSAESGGAAILRRAGIEADVGLTGSIDSRSRKRSMASVPRYLTIKPLPCCLR